MNVEKGSFKGRSCPKCGEDYNGILCSKCGYTPYPEDSMLEKELTLSNDESRDDEEPYYGIPFPRNIITVPCYVVAVILGVLVVLSFSLNSAISFLMLGIICVLIAIGKGVNIIYMALESINDRLSHTEESKAKIKNKVSKSVLDNREIGYMTFRVAGVTFNNDDGTNRQEIIAQIKKDRDYNSTENKLDLKEFSYDGKPALAVFIDGKQVGNVPATNVDFLLEKIEKERLVSAKLKFLGGGDLTYGIEITLGFTRE